MSNGPEKYERLDLNPGAVVNRDNDGLKAYKIRKQKDAEINKLKEDVADIKMMLQALLEKKNNDN